MDAEFRKGDFAIERYIEHAFCERVDVRETVLHGQCTRQLFLSNVLFFNQHLTQISVCALFSKLYRTF